MTKNNWGNEVEIEIRNRILVSIYAYAYEIKSDSLVSDSVFDTLCSKIDILIETGNEKLDDFFLNEFDESTGQWIHKHPELDKISKLYERFFEFEI